MFPIGRRWTLMTFIIAAITYVVRNYDIQGLDGIHIEPREPTAHMEPFPSPVDLPEPQVVFPQNPTSLPGTNHSSRTVNSPNPIPNTLPSDLPKSFPNNLPPGLPSTQPNTHYNAPTISNSSSNSRTTSVPFPDSFPERESNPGQRISLGERLAVWEESQSSKNDGTATGNYAKFADNLPPDRQSIRVLSFNCQVLGPAKRSKPHVMEMYVKLLRQFQVIALQEICSSQDDLLPELVERLNQSGRRFDYLIGPRVGRGASREQFAFIFDSDRIETDRYQLYTIDDPQDLLCYEPLVGWFRTKGIPPTEAFTFSLINVHSHSDFAMQENQSLPDLIRAIERDGRGEDDWIFAGDFGAGDSQLAFLQASGARFALLGVPTDTRGLQMLDNLIFSNQATREFGGRAGVLDFLRQFNLSLEQALEVSDHLPVWAEFTIHEGGLPGRVAPQVVPTAVQQPTSNLPSSVPTILPTVQFEPR